eukprot:CAMPEP_0178388754 /NCGR_PEP_ID=MMETSP0689_2-20121128/9757_1 /TAXON_ID=160604 /ORGANISM="Amphidinium massartii, Strain CS-259" /LENGTH=594 /DNA_ID=CAMNT_0020009169 /DNA_START=20 /DNA_END=1804 /DNA_ORIENTATION=-
MLRSCSWQLGAFFALLLACSANSQQDTQTHQKHQHHHGQGWFAQEMCGCTATKYEGCGLNSAQLYKDLTESYGLNVCKETNFAGDGNPEKTAEYLHPPDSPQLLERVTEECVLRQKLANVAKSYEKCIHVGDNKEACTSDTNKDHCEWEAQDVGKCGIDEEKLLRDFVGPDLQSHPLVRSIMTQDMCSEMSERACSQNSTCAWEPWHRRCVANAAVTFGAFIEHPTLFEVLIRADHEALCRAWHENVWQGDTCHPTACHLERGICATSYLKDSSRVSEPNITVIMRMKNDLCIYNGNQEVGGRKAGCPKGCHEHVYTAAEVEQHKKIQSHQHGTWFWCEADPIDVDQDLRLTDQDKKVALLFTIVRSATRLREERCNSLDTDIQQCKKVAEEHITCGGMFRPNASRVLGDGQHHRQPHSNDDEDESKATTAAGSDGKPPAASQITQAGVMQNVQIQKQTSFDGGFGFNGQVGALTEMVAQSNTDAFLQKFSDWLQSPEIQQNTAEKLKDFRQMWADAAPKGQKVAKAANGPAGQPGPPTGRVALLCVVCLVLAGTCGGFACATIFTTGLRDARDVAPLEIQYIRHEDPAGPSQA